MLFIILGIFNHTTVETESVSFIRGKAGHNGVRLGSLEDASLKHQPSDRTSFSFLTSNDSTDHVSETQCLKKLKDNRQYQKQQAQWCVCSYWGIPCRGELTLNWHNDLKQVWMDGPDFCAFPTPRAEKTNTDFTILV